MNSWAIHCAVRLRVSFQRSIFIRNRLYEKILHVWKGLFLENISVQVSYFPSENRFNLFVIHQRLVVAHVGPKHPYRYIMPMLIVWGVAHELSVIGYLDDKPSRALLRHCGVLSVEGGTSGVSALESPSISPSTSPGKQSLSSPSASCIV